jgi:hypothetical protein
MIYEYSESVILPDETCFLNALNNSYQVMNYVIKKYNYVPKILDILALDSISKRTYLYKKFYPNQLLFSNN